LFTEHLTLHQEKFSPSSYRKFELQKLELWKVGFTEENANPENLSPSSKGKFELQKIKLWKKHKMENIGVFFPVT
jgi:hypothetical protein